MLFRGTSFWLFRAGFFPAFFFFFVSVDRLDRFSAVFFKRFRSRNIEWADFPRLFLQARFTARTLTGPIFRAPFCKWFKAGPFAGPVSCACSARSSSKQEKQEQKKSFSQPAFYGGSFLIRAVKNPLSTFSLSRIFF